MFLRASDKSEPVWTWADQISTYRFWGLALFAMFAGAGLAVFHMVQMFVLMSDRNLRGLAPFFEALGGLYGFYLAWATLRWRSITTLAACVGLQLISMSLIVLASPLPEFLVCFLMGVIGLTGGRVLGTILAIIADGRGGGEAFLVASGVIAFIAWPFVTILPNLSGMLLARTEVGFVFAIVAICLVDAIIVILPVRRALFSEAPPVRGYALDPRQRDPIKTALLWLVPVYPLYWLYRAHGETRAFVQSRNILSPRAAVAISLFVPLLLPVLMSSLIEALRQVNSKESKSKLATPGAVFTWSIFLPPVAVWILQKTLNDCRSRGTSSAAQIVSKPVAVS
jgi:hypothetical protein